MKFLVVFLLAVCAQRLSAQQSISCKYIHNVGNGSPTDLDTCAVVIQNPKGFDAYESIDTSTASFPEVFQITAAAGSKTTIFPSILSKKFKNTIRVNFQNVGLQTISATAFSDIRLVFDLNIANNQITDIHPEAFINNQVLRYINLSNNKLRSLDENLFIAQTGLESLNLSNNLFVTLPAGLFKSMRVLGTLTINGCPNLESLPTYFFKPLTIVQNIQISSNKKFGTLHKGFLDGAAYINELNLSKNAFKDFPDGLFTLKSFAKYLDLSGNPISKIRNGPFVDANIMGIKFDYCPVTQIESAFVNTSAEVYRYLSFIGGKCFNGTVGGPGVGWNRFVLRACVV